MVYPNFTQYGLPTLSSIREKLKGSLRNVRANADIYTYRALSARRAASTFVRSLSEVGSCAELE